MTDNIKTEIDLIKKDVNTLAESLLEHISSLDEQVQDIIDAVTEGVEVRIREVIKEELANENEENE